MKLAAAIIQNASLSPVNRSPVVFARWEDSKLLMQIPSAPPTCAIVWKSAPPTDCSFLLSAVPFATKLTFQSCWR